MFCPAASVHQTFARATIPMYVDCSFEIFFADPQKIMLHLFINLEDIKWTTEKNGPASRAILMAMRIKRYGTVPSASPSTAGLGLP
jgi:hypothetical protein